MRLAEGQFSLWRQIVPWQLPEMLADPDGEKVDRVFRAMLRMGMICVAGLERAGEPSSPSRAQQH
jgi:predicted 3-demethylubiquinone-9 3-methyltransferase (glyoxalase superfamily)